MNYTLDEIDEMVASYQNDREARSLEALVTAFDPFITKWRNVVSGRYLNAQDPEVASFISLFRCESMMDLTNTLRKAAGGMEGGEIYDEVLLIFIQKITNFIYTEVHFPGYLKATMKYDMFRWVVSRLKVPAVVCSAEVYSRALEELYAPPVGIPDTELISNPSILPCLTPKEKMILTLRYMDGVSIDDIAGIYGYTHPTSVTNIISAARTKLLNWMKEAPPN